MLALQVGLPVLTIVGGTLILMLGVSVLRTHRVALALTIPTLLVALASNNMAWNALPEGGLNILNQAYIGTVQIFFNVLFILGAIVTALLAFSYFDSRSKQCEEFYILLLTATAGAMVLAGASHFATFILGLEILSISLYAMIAYPADIQKPLEAAAKYLVLSAVASTAILFGMALIYNATGSMAFTDLAVAEADGYYLLGQGMICVGIAFKLSLVPFHMWTPDVYQGAPSVVTGYVATVSKGAVIALLIRYVLEADVLDALGLFYAVGAVAILSMVVGNLLALMQKNLKRLLAYSSIAHLGYLLIAVLVVNSARPEFVLETILLYVTAYFIITLAAFGIVSITTVKGKEDNELLESYTGLFWRNPVLASILTVVALSLAGIPLTVGFIAKFYVFAVGVDGEIWTLIWALIVGSAIGVYYYLRIIYTMTKPAGEDAVALPVDGPHGMITVSVLGGLMVVLGIYPTPMIDLIQSVLELSGL